MSGTVSAILIIATVGLTLMVMIGGIMWFGFRPEMDRKAYRELRDLRKLVARVDRIAYEQRETDPSLSILVIDEIQQHRQRGDEDQRELEGH
jgi:hypothetical protein